MTVGEAVAVGGRVAVGGTGVFVSTAVGRDWLVSSTLVSWGVVRAELHANKNSARKARIADVFLIGLSVNLRVGFQ